MKYVELKDISFEEWNEILTENGSISLLLEEGDCLKLQKILLYQERAYEGRDVVKRIAFGFYLGLFRPKIMLLCSYIFLESLQYDLNFSVSSSNVELTLKRA
ncbi:hypothetical protein [Thaumasiovibrio sp. DFM-14]|uniref:hypothetical protein n=1 Tax=Thaumasiovibrio sp. DFM-14 TaxID=3384792 RepID=UPI0039A336F8